MKITSEEREILENYFSIFENESNYEYKKNNKR